jgi:hypothetical protein
MLWSLTGDMPPIIVRLLRLLRLLRWLRLLRLEAFFLLARFLRAGIISINLREKSLQHKYNAQ